MYDQGEKWSVPYTTRCKWCNAGWLEWVLNDKTKRWELQDESGEKHVHQPPKHETD